MWADVEAGKSMKLAVSEKAEGKVSILNKIVHKRAIDKEWDPPYENQNSF